MGNNSMRNSVARAALLCLAVILTAALLQRERAHAGQAAAPNDAAGVLYTLPATAPAETRPASQPAGPRSDDPVARIREEGMNHSQVMATLSYLSDVIGPRLTGSPNLHRANEWTRQTLASWGLVNAHLEPWGPFGRGWSLKRFSMQVIEPQTIILEGYPRAWSPGFDKPFDADVVYLEAKNEADLQKYHAKLKGAVVLHGQVRPLTLRSEAPTTRVSDGDLLQLANAPDATMSPPGQARAITPNERRALFASTDIGRRVLAGATSRPAGGPGLLSEGRLLAFLDQEGAAIAVSPSLQGDGGTIFVAAASIPGQSDFRRRPNAPHVWSPDAPHILPQVVLPIEQYNRLVRMIQADEKLKMNVDLQVQFHDDDPMAYNTIAEIPGGDLKDEIVMVGGHMDSWHSGTGATDNGAGVAASMEAVRIISALGLHPRRTIRIGLWTGEEEGLLGSKAYVTEHFGSFPEPAGAGGTTRPAGADDSARQPATQATAGAATGPATGPATRPARVLTRRGEYEKLSVYFNLDNGTGKIRGVYLQGNEAARPLFRRWLEPFADLDASTLTLSNTGGTDHISFDAIGLPAYQFIQDPIEYFNRTHHSSADVFDRIQGDDLKQASTIMAAFLYHAAMMDERFPRKPLPAAPSLPPSAPPDTGPSTLPAR
jgi:hypothetical protein